MCDCALSVMLLTVAVVLPTPHDYSGTFQGGYSTWFTASKRVLEGARKATALIDSIRANTAMLPQRTPGFSLVMSLGEDGSVPYV